MRKTHALKAKPVSAHDWWNIQQECATVTMLNGKNSRLMPFLNSTFRLSFEERESAKMYTYNYALLKTRRFIYRIVFPKWGSVIHDPIWCLWNEAKKRYTPRRKPGISHVWDQIFESQKPNKASSYYFVIFFSFYTWLQWQCPLALPSPYHLHTVDVRSRQSLQTKPKNI